MGQQERDGGSSTATERDASKRYVATFAGVTLLVAFLLFPRQGNTPK